MTKKELAELKKLLPDPVGYHVLIAMPLRQDKIGSILMTEEQKYREATASITGCVMKVGPDAYNDKSKYPTGPWCREGDWVIFRSYSGTRLKVKDQEFRILNDDSIEATVLDARIVERAI